VTSSQTTEVLDGRRRRGRRDVGVQARVDELGEVAQAVAILGDAGDLAILGGMTGLPSAALEQAATPSSRRKSCARLARKATGVDALTPSERRVAALAASDRSNKVIAQELFVTTKSVEVHLSNTYRKLGGVPRRSRGLGRRRR
jgi:DNA-binding NarL/FixJ family response regulator